MCAPFLPARPAFAALRPSEPAYVPAPAGVADGLAVLVGCPGATVRRMVADVRNDGHEDGFYRLDTDGNAFFLKVVPQTRRPALEAAERIAVWLAGQGVRVNAALPGYPRPWRGRFAVFAHSFVDGGFASPAGRADEELRALGRGLAGLHRTLAALPFAGDLAAAWERRRRMLEAARRAVLGGREIGPPWLRERLTAPFDLDGPAQPVHADLHCANVLFPRDGSDPVFLDFEDCAHAFLPPAADVAKALERFVLAAVADDARALALGRTLLSAYAEAAGTAGRPGELRAALHAQSRRALCDLAAQTLAGQEPAAAEWDKFAALLEMLEQRSALVAALDGVWQRGHPCGAF